MTPEKSGHYLADRFGNILDGPYPDWNSAHQKRTNCGDPEEIRIKQFVFEVRVEHCQLYHVDGIEAETEAREVACIFAAGNVDLLPEGIVVTYGEMEKNIATDCRLVELTE